MIKNKFIYSPSLVLYLPLYELDGASFQSKDAYGHLCTVTGGIWTPRGGNFNGTTDLLDCGRLTDLEGATKQWMIEFWIRVDSRDTNTRALVAYDANNALNNIDIYMYWNGTVAKTQLGGAGAEVTTSITDLEDGQFHHIGFGKSANNVVIYEDMQLLDDTAQAGGAMSSSHKLYICDDHNVSHGQGIVGELRIYNRLLTLIEFQRNELATKGRYQ